MKLSDALVYLKKGMKLYFNDELTVIYERPYDEKYFLGKVEGEDGKMLYRFKYKQIDPSMIISESMELEEAKQILTEAGYIVEGSMNLKDKIINAKKFNLEKEKEKIITFFTKHGFNLGKSKGDEIVFIYDDKHLDVDCTVELYVDEKYGDLRVYSIINNDEDKQNDDYYYDTWYADFYQDVLDTITELELAPAEDYENYVPDGDIED